MSTLTDLVTEKVTAALREQLADIAATTLGEIEDRANMALAAVSVAAQTRLDELVANLPSGPIFSDAYSDPATEEFGQIAPVEVDRKDDAKERAWRTAQQGLLGVLVTILVTVADAVAAPSFDLTSLSDWKLVVGAVGTAAVATAVAFVSRLYKAPKSQR